jgi:hypothetical protein
MQLLQLVWSIRAGALSGRELASTYMDMRNNRPAKAIAASEAEVRALVSRLDAQQWLAQVKGQAGGLEQQQQQQPQGPSAEAEREVYTALFELCRAGKAQAALYLLRVSEGSEDR